MMAKAASVVRSLGLLAFSACLSAAALAQDRAFDVALFGDMPYTKVQELEYQRVLSALNANDLALVVHVGDFQFDPRGYNRRPAGSSMPCVEENYQAIYESFQTVRHPFILTPGDNDWSDCWRMEARKVDPLDLLARIRTRFFPEGKSLGQRTIAVEQQSSDHQFSLFRENLRWRMGGVLFITLHTVGDNDNFGRTPEMDAEHAVRKAANLAWLRQAFAQAKATDSRGLMIFTQANPRFETAWSPGARRGYMRHDPPAASAASAPSAAPATPAGFEDYLRTLAEEMETYGKPVAYLHGDTHIFRIDKPLYSRKTNRAFENFTRAETFGWPNSHWV